MKNSLKRALCVLLFVCLAFAATSGPNFPTTATGNTTTLGGGVNAWTNPTNIEAADGSNAFVSPGAATSSDDLIGQGYGFSIPPGATIKGILVEVNCHSSVVSGSLILQDKHIKLLKGGTLVGTDKAALTTIPTGGITLSYGGSSDLWGTTWSPSDINNSGFGVDWVGWQSNTGASGAISVDYIRVTVTYAQSNSAAMLQVF